MREILRGDEIIFCSEYGIKEFLPFLVREIRRQAERDFGTAFVLPIFGEISIQEGDIIFLEVRYDTFINGILGVGSANDSQISNMKRTE